MPYQRPVRQLEPLDSIYSAYCCAEAERFAEWVDMLVSRLTKDDSREPTVEQVWEAKAKLLDEYRKERYGVEKDHRDKLQDDDGGPCLYGIFLAAADRLADVRIQPKITTPTRRKTPPAAEPPTPQPRRPKSVADVLSEALLGGTRDSE